MHRDAGLWQYRALTLLSILFVGVPAGNGYSNRPELPQCSRDVWDLSRGYPGGRSYGITQTTDGYLWIGTDRGLIRFDGSVFQVFRQIGPEKMPIDAVYALAGDQKGNLLISTLQGLQRVRLRNEQLEELPPLAGQPVDPLFGIYQEHKGNILIATVRRGMIAYDGTSFTPLPGTRPDITAAVQARDGTVWMGTATQGLFAFPREQNLHSPEDLHQVKINALLPFGEHGLRMGTDKGLLQWDGTHTPERLFGKFHIRAMLEDRQQVVWLGSTQGLYRIGSEAGDQSIVPYSGDVVTCLFEDREGNVWAGTSTGIVRLRERVLTTYPLDADPGGSSGPLFADDRGTVWCTTPKLGLVRIVDGRAERILGATGYTSLAVAGLDLWLGRKDGTLLRAKLPTSPLHFLESREEQLSHPIISIFKSRAGSLWVGMQNAGVAEIVNGRTKLYSSVDGFVLNTVSAIEQSRDGVMWFATANGLASFWQGHWQSYTARDGVPPGRINCILADHSGMLWIGSEQGLAYIENGSAHIPAWNLPLLHEPIFGIAADRDDFLWIVTSSHVVRVKRAALLHAGADSISVRQFGVDDGLPALSPNRTSRTIIADSIGRIWMSLGNSIVMADPFRVSLPTSPTLVQFQRISADELLLPLGETVSVPAGHVRTVIRFAGLNLAAPDRVRFRYRLENLDRHWNETSSAREAVYTNLAPGSYQFQVQATTVDGLWDGPAVKVALHVEAQWWQSLWFRSSAVLGICVMSFVIYQLRLRTLKRQWTLRFQERLDERTRIARDLHDTLLQSFQGLILRFQAVRDMLPEQPQDACEALDSAIDRAADAITEGRDAVQALRGEEDYDDLGESLAAIDREWRDEAFGHQDSPIQSTYRVLVEGTPRCLHPVVRDDLYRIAREAVRNAFRHAHAKEIELDIRYDEEALRLRIRDDGCGIDPKVLSSGRRKGHYGLPGMRERAMSIGGKFEIWSELRRGTEIEVTIPGMVAYVRVEDSGNSVLY